MATADIESELSDTPASFENAAAVVRELLEQTAIIAGAFAVQVLLDGRTPGGPRSAHAVRVADDGVTYRYAASAEALDSSQNTVSPHDAVRWSEDIGSVAGEPLTSLLDGRSMPGAELDLEIHNERLGKLYVALEDGGPGAASAGAALTALARQTAMAVAGLTEVEDLKGLVEQSRVLLEIARVSTSTLQLDEMLERLVSAAARLTGADRASIWLLSDDGDRLLPSAMYGVDDKFLMAWKTGDQLLTDQPLSREALESGKPVAVLDAGSDPRTDKTAVEFFGDKSLLIVPLTLGTRAIGTLYLNDVGIPHEYTPADIEIALAIASQATSAIENARLYRESEDQRDRLRASFRRLGDALGSGPTLDETLQLVVSIAAEIMNADACVLELDDPSTGEATLRASAGLDESAVDRLAVAGDNGSPNGPVSERLAAILAQRVPDGKPRSRKAKSPTYPLLAVPLSVDETKIGSLTVAGRSSRSFARVDRELLSGFAGGAAVAIQRSQLAVEVKARLDHLSGLYSLSQAISTLGDFNETLAHIVDQIAAVLDVERCVILLLDDDGRRLVGHPHAYGLEAERAASITLSKDFANASWDVLETGEAFVSNDTLSDKRITQTYVEKLGDESLLIVPMRVGETPVGVIRASNKRGAGFTDSDARLLNIFATQAAVIVQNATFFRQVTREAQQLEAIISAASDGIVIVDALGRIITFNGAIEAITGWPREEAIGRDCEDLIHAPASRPDDEPQAAFPLKQVLRSQQSVPYSETVLLHRDGRRVDVRASYSFVPSPWDESPLAVAIVSDISRIEEVEGMKSDFVSLVSHELRTPLALIKGYIATMLNPEVNLDSGTDLRFREGINEAADRLVLIVNNLLSASRIESGLFRPHLQDIDLEAVVERVVSDFQEGGHGRLELHWSGKDFNIVADAEQISLVLSNLIGNAIKYAGGDEQLAIQISVDGRENDIVVAVRDRGIGIPSGLRGRIFEKFYRGPESMSAPGSGLGLYICQKVVEAHGGTIELDRDPEVGTQISFVLPRNGGRDVLDEKFGLEPVTES